MLYLSSTFSNKVTTCLMSQAAIKHAAIKPKRASSLNTKKLKYKNIQITYKMNNPCIEA
jgi:hypothetical protein